MLVREDEKLLTIFRVILWYSGQARSNVSKQIVKLQ